MEDIFEIVSHNVFNKASQNQREILKEELKKGADELEVDLAISKDGVVFLYHDECIRVGLKKINLKDLKFEKIKALLPYVLTIDDLIKDFPNTKFVLELKTHTQYRKIIKKICPLIKKRKLKAKFISFSIKALTFAKKECPKVYCAYIATSAGHDKTSGNRRIELLMSKKHIDMCLKNKIDEISGYWFTSAPHIIRKAQEEDLIVGLGPVNNRGIFSYCMKNDVNRLYTDDVAFVHKMRR